jgi:hypothetical protein
MKRLTCGNGPEMTVTTVPEHTHRREWPARRVAAGALTAVLAAVTAVFAPHKASVARLWDMPLTVAGLGCIDAAFFTWHLMAGLLVLGASLIVLNELTAEDRA